MILVDVLIPDALSFFLLFLYPSPLLRITKFETFFFKLKELILCNPSPKSVIDIVLMPGPVFASSSDLCNLIFCAFTTLTK